ncbi:MAG: hypothetical protein WCO56_19270 [Verrucomicrobiota bacterium]
MRRSLLAILCLVSVVVSASWLVGYGRAIWPFVADGVRDRDISFLTYPNIKWYTEVDETTGRMSEMKIDWFSVVDGPTGIVYAHRYFPCWIVSLGAAFAFVGSAAAGLTMWPDRAEDRV